MTPNSPLTYEDFISQVKEAMPLDSPLRTEFVLKYQEGLYFDNNKANSDFKFEDIEVGKIYAFWPSKSQPKWEIWFMTPYDIQNERNYSVYWCYYSRPGGGITKQSGGVDPCNRWVGYIWNAKRWKVIENNIPPFNAFINWNETPLEVKQ